MERVYLIMDRTLRLSQPPKPVITSLAGMAVVLKSKFKCDYRDHGSGSEPDCSVSLKSYSLNLTSAWRICLRRVHLIIIRTQALLPLQTTDIFLMDGLETVLQIQMPNQPQYS